MRQIAAESWTPELWKEKQVRAECISKYEKFASTYIECTIQDQEPQEVHIDCTESIDTAEITGLLCLSTDEDQLQSAMALKAAFDEMDTTLNLNLDELPEGIAEQMSSVETYHTNLQNDVNVAAFVADLAGLAFAAIWDTGSSTTVTNNRSDFIEFHSYKPHKCLKGLAKGLLIHGHGKVRWAFLAEDGTYRVLTMPAIYVPEAPVCLISPQTYIQARKRQSPQLKIKGEVHDDGFYLYEQGAARLVVTYNEDNNLPMSEVLSPASLDKLNTEFHTCVVSEANQNLSHSQKQLLKWHFRLGHINMQTIQGLLRSGILATTEPQKKLHRAAANCELPVCASCQFGRAKRRPVPGKTTQSDSKHEGALKRNNLLPGQEVSVDHFICSTRGRLPNSRGRTSTTSMYQGGAIFVDHASGYVHIEHQVSLNSHETMMAKSKFENQLREVGVIVQTYRSDNGAAFSSREYTEHLSAFKQVTSFAGVGAHHHNGVAERAIQTIMAMARTMMLHSAVHWPNVADASLWPEAVDYATYIYNSMPNRRTGLAPVEILTSTKMSAHKYHDFHVWGCPVYVLDPKMQDGKSLPRWKVRSRRGQFMGISRKHASCAPRVLNLESHYISPQFHVLFDDFYTSVDADPDSYPDWSRPEWSKMFGESRYQYQWDPDEANIVPELDPEWLDEQHDKRNRYDSRRHEIEAVHDRRTPPMPLSPQPPIPVAPRTDLPSPIHPTPVDTPLVAPSPPPTPLSIPVPSATSSPTPSTPPTPASRGGLSTSAPSPLPSRPIEPSRTRETPNPNQIDPDAGRRRSTRLNKGQRTSKRYDEEFHFTTELFGLITTHFDVTQAIDDDNDLEWTHDQHLAAFMAAYPATKSDPDTLRFDQARRQADWEFFEKAAADEIKSLEMQGTWIVRKRANLPQDAHVLPGTWTFKRKRHPDGRLMKHKARFCVRGDLQKQVGETFAPVVQWSTVRMLMTLTLAFDLHTRCIDFSNAFVQADLPKPIYIHLPMGFKPPDGSDDSILELKKSLYGLCEAPKLWFDHLSEKLTSPAMNFKQSKFDPCLFYRNGCFLLCFVDDVVLASRDASELEAVIEEIKGLGFKLTEEGELSEFLGIKIERHNKKFTLTQPGLIQKVIKTTRLANLNPVKIPATKTLGACKDEPKHDESWSYPSVVGMLLYLSTNTRPDIAFAVHQCARFMHDPRASHSRAVAQIVRYLVGTADKGLIMEPTKELKLDCWVDADFAGLWKEEDPQDVSSARSRTGYLIKLGNVPLVWKSKLQTEISLATAESEYQALSLALRELIHLRNLLSEMAEALSTKNNRLTVMKSTCFEDNAACLKIAQSPFMTPRSRHYAVKYHHFKTHVQRGTIVLEKIDTKVQQADALTKELNAETFQRLRKLYAGW
jgi:hypothetical protein